jgi:hypothetical protein
MPLNERLQLPQRTVNVSLVLLMRVGETLRTVSHRWLFCEATHTLQPRGRRAVSQQPGARTSPNLV